MGILRAGDREFHTLGAGQVLTVTPSPVGTGVVWQYPDTGSNPTSGTQMSGASVTVGPFTGSVRLAVECRTGAVDWTAGVPQPHGAPDAAEAAGLQALVSGDGIVVGSTEISIEAATANTMLIRAALAVGQCTVMGGRVTVNGSLIVSRDNGVFKTAPDSEIVMLSGLEICPVKTSLEEAAGTAVTVSWSAGLTATLNWTGHPLAVGDGVIVQGAAEERWRQPLKVIAVIDANSVTVQLRRRVTAGPTGSLTAWRMLRNVTIDVAIDYNWSGATTSTGTINRHCAAILGLKDSRVRVRGRNAYKYALLMLGCMDTEWYVDGTNVSDIGKVYGPSSGLRGRVSGISRDDQFSYQSQEPPAFATYQKWVGPMYDCDTAVDVASTPSGASSGSCVLYLDETYKPDNITFRGYAASQLRGGLSLKAGDTFTPANCKAGKVVLADMVLAPKAAEFAFVSSVPVEQLIIDRPTVVPGDGTTQLFRFESTSNHDRVVIRDFSFEDGAWPSSTSIAINFNGALRKAEIVGNRVTGAASNYRHVNIGTGGAVEMVHFIGGEYDGGSCLVILPTGVTSNPTIILDGLRAANLVNGVIAQSACTVVLRNNDFSTISSAVIRGQTAAINVKIVDGGGNKFTGAALLSMLNSSTVTVYGQELPVTLSATGVQKTVRGQFCTSATAVGTIPAGAPVVCNGTGWIVVGGDCFPLTFTAALTAATSGTLTAAFGGTTGTYMLAFSDGSNRLATLTNGSTSVSWTGAVTAAAGASYQAGF